jgi:hypothetical protein
MSFKEWSAAQDAAKKENKAQKDVKEVPKIDKSVVNPAKSAGEIGPSKKQ